MTIIRFCLFLSACLVLGASFGHLCSNYQAHSTTSTDEWARPIFGLASDFKSLTRDEREERDYAHLSQSKRTRLSSGERRPSQDDDFE